MSSSQTLTPNQQPGSIPMAKQQYGSTPGGGSALSAPNLRPMNSATPRAAWPTSRQNSGSMPTVRPQTEGLRDQPLPITPRPLSPASPSLIPPRGSGLHANGSASANDVTMKPAFEKKPLRKVTPVRDGEAGQPLPQSPFASGNSSPSFGTMEQTWRRQPTQQVAYDAQQGIQRTPSQPLTGYRTSPFDAGTTMRGAPRMSPAGGGIAQRQPASLNAPPRAPSQPSNSRPLLPGVQLRGNRYRLQELVERQDWLSGVFEAIWIGKDAQRNGARVMISEVVLPEMTSVMSQSILRTATMALANVGRHPRIPALWDAFGDQGRSFFVFEPIEGESLAQRLRYSGRPLPEQDVIECCLQMTEVLDLLSQQSPQVVHGLIRPEHIIAGRNGSQYFLTNFSVVLAGGATQFVVGMERNHLSSYTPPEYARGLVDVRTDMYSLIATAYHAVTGAVPSGISGSIPPAQRINHAISSEFDAILTKGLRAVANQRYQRPSELRQDLLALRSVSSTLVSSNNRNAAGNRAPTQTVRSGPQAEPTQRSKTDFIPPLPIRLDKEDQPDEQVLLLPKPEELPVLKQRDDRLYAAFWMGAILIGVIILVVLSQVLS